MADAAGFNYRPSIAPPDRVPDAVELDARILEALAEEGISRADLPKDALLAVGELFASYEQKGKELKETATWLLDKAIEDIDGYFGGAPASLRPSFELLLQRELPDDTTDPAWTLTECEKRCIFRVSGYYSNEQDTKDIQNALNDLDSKVFAEEIGKKAGIDDYLKQVYYSLKLLIAVVRICYAIIVHSTVGYLCGFFRGKIRFGYRKKIAGKKIGFEFSIGDAISDHVFGPAERILMSLMGMNCLDEGEKPVDCSSPNWDRVNMNDVPCCTTSPVFFQRTPSGMAEFTMDRCFKKFIRQQLDPTGTGSRAICDSTNCAGDTEPTAEEKAAAKVVAKYLLENGSVYGVMDRSDVPALSRAISYADQGVSMSQQVQSALNTSQQYRYTGESRAVWDCFGYQPTEVAGRPSYRSSQGTLNPADLPLLEQGTYLMEFVNAMDEAVTRALQIADLAVIGTSRLAQWGASKELCCWVYLMVMIGSMWHSLTTKGSFCQFMPSLEGAEAMRDTLHLRYAYDMRNSKAMSKFVALLKLLKQIVDLFRNKMNRAVFLQGIGLPLHDMWEQVKITLANGLATFLDVLFAPLDMVLAGLRGFPELRAMIDNDCFNFGKWMDFLACTLGDLKASLVNWVMQYLDFTMNDLVIVNDMYISRSRLAFLDALSRLLGLMINLIFGLRDCYDPSSLSNQIVERQMDAQYRNVKRTTELFRSVEDQNRLYAASFPKMTGTAISALTDDLIPGSLSASFSHEIFGEIDTFMRTALEPPISLSSLTGESGELRSRAEFDRIMSEQGSVSLAALAEDVRYIFDILAGENA